MKNERIYEIRLGKTSSIPIEIAQGTFMGKVFDLARESKLEGKELDIVWTNAEEDDKEQEGIGVIFQHTCPKDRIITSNTLEVSRFPDGEVELKTTVGMEAEHHAHELRHYMPPGEAERLGRALCCIDCDTFDGLVGRAKNFGED